MSGFGDGDEIGGIVDILKKVVGSKNGKKKLKMKKIEIQKNINFGVKTNIKGGGRFGILSRESIFDPWCFRKSCYS